LPIEREACASLFNCEILQYFLECLCI
jgi:hypothetical protein